MQPKIYTTQEHHIRNDQIDTHALFVLEQLHQAGFQAYLVGGSVRDLLLKQIPKDFDISTSARPEEIKRIFRRCHLIGKRFRLAHVYFGHKCLEVATFRSGQEDEQLIVRDNVWGSEEEDASRRDFTINALFYDPLDHKIIDYVGGFEDLKNHKLKVIGNPLVRFRQDPVRMIRMLKFRARFGFTVDKEELDAMKLCQNEIEKSSKARILEELFRMLESSFSCTFYALMSESGLLPFLLPQLDQQLHGPFQEKVKKYLKTIDEMNQKKALPRCILTAALVFPSLEEELAVKPVKNVSELLQRIEASLNEFYLPCFPHFPRKIRYEAQDILQLQFSLTPSSKVFRKKIVFQKMFFPALLFLKLRSLIEPKFVQRYEYWKKIHQQLHQPKEKL